MVNIREKNMPTKMYKTKCPYKMNPTRIVIHNTANDASAENEIAYMQRNSSEVSFHLAVDDKEAVQGVPFNRNTWNAGDGKGKGNMEGISIEICYSKSGGARFAKAQDNAAQVTAWLLNEYGWGIDRVTKHQDYNGKHCPHRTLDDYGWDFFLALVKKHMPQPKKSVAEVAKDVIAGKYGNGNARVAALKKAGYDPVAVQTKVDELMKATTNKATPKRGTAVTLKSTPLYANASTTKVSSRKTGTYYLYDGIEVNGRYRITNKAKNCGKKPTGINVTGWITL